MDADASRDPALPGAALEASAEELYEDAPCGYLSTLPDGTIVKVNRTFLSWTGYAREDLLGERRLVDLLTAGGRIFHETHYAPLLALQGSASEMAIEIRRVDGTRLPVLLSSVVKRDAAQQPLLIRTTVFSAVDRRGYERELVLARDRERAARERTERLQRITAALAARLDPAEIAEALLAELAGVADVELVWTSCPVERLSREDARPDVLPLAVGERTFGVLVLAGDTAPSEDEHAFLVTCARQCAQALDRAALLAQERETVHVLQRSLLDSEPLREPRLRIGAHYGPAVETLEVGGDWHDAFPAGEGRVGVVVGDVVGRGIRAASAMGQLRSATRALAGAELGGPAQLLARLDRFAARLPLALMATLVYAEIELDGGVVRYACAGHPPPLLLQPGAEPVVLWEGRSLPLGVAPDAPRPADGRLALAPGGRLLLYTDGLVERHDEPLDRGLERLAAELRRRRSRDPQTLIDELVERLRQDGAPRDDVCALCVELGGGRRADGAR